ncbi:uncharacterized protein LOC119719644 [Patiria miniata]|uniref:RNA helicase n=1 Tax=Patiria miniata TaxID=46514 RepID=A0A913Z079_PATMI|nr:uncharacterized protein LOC119719644 [Patiria miniata]
MVSTGISAFHETLFSISRELTDNEVRNLKYLCKDYLTVSQKEGITNALALFEILEQKRIISEDNFTFLLGSMENLQRNDLRKKFLEIIPESEAAHAEARKEDSPKEGSSKEGSPKEASNGPQNRSGNAASFSSGSESSTAGGPRSYDLKNSPLTVGDSSDNVYNYGSSTDGPASPLEANCALGSTPGSASASSTGGLTIIAKNSPITLGNSFGNQYNYGSKESPSTAPPRHQPQDRVPNANGSGDHDKVCSQSLSSAQQGHYPSSLNPATLRTPAGFCPHSSKARSIDAAQQGDSGSVINPMSSGQEARMPVTSPQSKLLSKMKAERARVNETPTLDGPNVMASQPSGPVLDDERSLVKAHNPEGNPHVESFSEESEAAHAEARKEDSPKEASSQQASPKEASSKEGSPKEASNGPQNWSGNVASFSSGKELNKEEETVEVRDNSCYENCIFVQDSTKTDIFARFTEKRIKEEKRAEASADNHYQNCIFVQNSTHTNIAVMPAKCRRNSSENLLEEIRTMIRGKTLPEKVVQLLDRCDAEIEDAEEGCVKLLLGFRSVEGLKKFWEIYSSGEFQECLGRELSTGDIEISEEDYNRALRKLKDASDKKGDGQSPDQNLHQVCNPLPTCDPVHQKGTLKPPGLFTSSHQGQGSTSGPLLEMSTDSYNDAERVREARNPQGSKCNDQQNAREEARAIGRRQPTLRGYQRELAERPLKGFENHIICAPTGSGKTLTAAYICYQYRTWFETNVPDKHFKALFFVNMRHLTVQQRDAFRWYFPNKQDVQTIGEQQSFEDALKLDDAKPAVLMLTAQILVNAMKSDKIDIKDLDMLIFDDCHYTDLKHPYKKIMKTYLKEKQRLPKPQRVGVSGPHLPFIIGLSASLGVESVDHLLTLCGNMDCKGVDRVLRNTAELKLHVNSPDEVKIEYVSTPNDKQFADLLEALMTDIEDQLPDIEEHPLPPRGCQLYEAEVMRRLTDAQKLGDRTAIVVYVYLYEYNRAMMLFDDLSITDCLSHLEKFHDRPLLTAHKMQDLVEVQCQKLFDLNRGEMKRLGSVEGEHSNEKLGNLASLLHDIFTEKPDSKGIVLLRLKLATTAVADFLSKSTLLNALPCRVIPQQFVGQEDIEDACLVEAEQRTVLESFKHEDGCNVLVATDIALLGNVRSVLLPACNFVIRYNFVSNEIGTVQSKGRARARAEAEGSQYSLFVESRLLNKKTKYDNRNKVKKMEEAMEELEAMTEDQRLDRIQERQNKILEYIRLPKEEAKQQWAMTSLDRITIHCKECSALVCKASELRRNGDAGHVSCISPEFKRWVKEVKYSRPQRFPDIETVGLISCGTLDCGNQLGTMQKFLKLQPPDGYALKAQSFEIHFEMGGVKIPTMWKKAGFQILQG